MKKQTLFLSTLLIVSTFTFANPPKTTTVAKTTKPVVILPSVATDAVKYEKSNATEDVVVDGKDVLISGNENKLTITGNVSKILITGKNNDITIVSVNEIIIAGSGNFVSWEKTNSANAKPLVQDKGGYNNVGKKSGNAMTKEED